MATNLKTSAAGRASIRQREGCILKTYLDSVGVATCCVGHTGRMSPPTPRMGQTFTAEQADAFLAADLAPVEEAINSAITVPITQNQFDAMASLAFNIGVTGFLRSTVVRELNARNFDKAADAILLWSTPAVLKARRAAERAQFLTPDGKVEAPQVATAAPANKPPAPVTVPNVGFMARLKQFIGITHGEPS